MTTRDNNRRNGSEGSEAVREPDSWISFGLQATKRHESVTSGTINADLTRHVSTLVAT